MFKVDGNNSLIITDNSGHYGVWRIVDDEGSLIVACYGPNSLGAAQKICDVLNETGKLIQPDFTQFKEY